MCIASPKPIYRLKMSISQKLLVKLWLFLTSKKDGNHTNQGGCIWRPLFCVVSDKTEIFWHLRARQKITQNLWFFKNTKILKIEILTQWSKIDENQTCRTARQLIKAHLHKTGFCSSKRRRPDIRKIEQ